MTILALPLLWLSLLFGPRAIESEIAQHYSSGEGSESAQVELKLFANGQFEYANRTQSEPLIVKGNWNEKNQVINLVSRQASNAFPERWKIDKKFPCIKARQGLTFYRICASEG